MENNATGFTNIHLCELLLFHYLIVEVCNKTMLPFHHTKLQNVFQTQPDPHLLKWEVYSSFKLRNNIVLGNNLRAVVNEQ